MGIGSFSVAPRRRHILASNGEETKGPRSTSEQTVLLGYTEYLQLQHVGGKIKPRDGQGFS